MKNFTLIIIGSCLLSISTSCKKDVTKPSVNSKEDETFNKNIMTENLPYTSERVEQFYKHDVDSSDYIVEISDKKKLPIHFNNADHINIKENDFEISPTQQNKYYIIETFKFSDTHTGKLIIFNTSGENDSKILNVQLNSYINNVLVDKLLLDCRFTFETEYYRTFKITKDQIIEIVKFSVDSLEYNDAGDIIGEKQKADTTRIKVVYKIDSQGQFIKR